MMISSDLPSPALVKPAPLSTAPEASETRGVPDHDGDSDDGAATSSLKSFQGTKVNTTA